MKFYFIALLFLLTTVCFANALDSGELTSYFAFNSIVNNYVNDLESTQDLFFYNWNYTNTTGLFILDGAPKIGNQLLSQVGITQYNDSSLNTASWTINYWINSSGPTGNQWLRFYNGSAYIKFTATSSGTGISTGITQCYNTTRYIVTNQWNMITITYDTNNFLYYINGYLTCNYTFNLPSSYNNFFLNGSNTKYDELSYWSDDLTALEIEDLYNLGTGLTYSQIIDIPVVDNIINYFNICIGGSSYCTNLSVNNGVASACSFANTVSCYPLECKDNSSYWESLGLSPPNLNYNAQCALCANECTTENSTQCYDSYNINICHMSPNGCYQWYITPCGYGNYCDLNTAKCSQSAVPTNNGSTVPIGYTTQEDQDMWQNFFNLDASKASNKLLIAILAIIICGAFSAGLIFAIGNATGQSLPSFVTIPLLAIFLLLPTIYFIAIGFIPLWILILLIIICASIFAVYVRNEMIGQGG